MFFRSYREVLGGNAQHPNSLGDDLNGSCGSPCAPPGPLAPQPRPCSALSYSLCGRTALAHPGSAQAHRAPRGFAPVPPCERARGSEPCASEAHSSLSATPSLGLRPPQQPVLLQPHCLAAALGGLTHCSRAPTLGGPTQCPSPTFLQRQSLRTFA